MPARHDTLSYPTNLKFDGNNIRLIGIIRFLYDFLKNGLRKITRVNFQNATLENRIPSLQNRVYFLTIRLGIVLCVLMAIVNLFLTHYFFLFAADILTLLFLIVLNFGTRYYSVTKLSKILVVGILGILTVSSINTGGLGPGNLMLFVTAFCLVLVLLPLRESMIYSVLVWMCFFGVMIYEINTPTVRISLPTSLDIAKSNILVTVVFFITFLLIYVIIRSYDRVRVENELRTQELAEKKKIIESNYEFKKKIFAVLFHDLKSPIQSLASLIELLKTGVISKEDVNNFIPDISKRVQSTSSSVDGLIEWFRFEMTNVDSVKRGMDLGAVTKEIAEELSSQSVAKNLHVVNRVRNLRIRSDEFLIKSVLRNLMTNAIKFSFNGGSIELEDEVSNGVVTISVKDHGLGMNDDVLGKLFSFELNSLKGTNGEKGSGLGLALCLQLAKKLGGDLMVESKLDVGTTFRFVIPVSSEPVVVEQLDNLKSF